MTIAGIIGWALAFIFAVVAIGMIAFIAMLCKNLGKR